MRTPITLKIKFKSGSLDQFIERYSVDVSRGGIFIRTKEPLAVGTQLKFEFQLQDASSLIAGEGTVVWIREHDPTRTGVAPGMGVRFDRIQPASQQVLDRILLEKSKRGDAQMESRFDAGVRASATASGTVSTPDKAAPHNDFGGGDSKSHTPLPAPVPGLGDDEFAEESTRVMQNEIVQALADRTRGAESFDSEPTRKASKEQVEALSTASERSGPSEKVEPPKVEVAEAKVEAKVETRPEPAPVEAAAKALPKETSAASEKEPERRVAVATAVPPRRSPATVPMLIIVGALVAAGGYYAFRGGEAPITGTSDPVSVVQGMKPPVLLPEVKEPDQPTVDKPGTEQALAKPVAEKPLIEKPLIEKPATALAASGMSVPIASDPPGALVTVDGKPLPDVTPTTLAGLDAKKVYDVRVAMKGFHDWKIRLKPKAGDQLDAALVPNEKLVEISSTPEGADVLLDGKKVGRTPFTIHKIDVSKSHALEIKRTGFVAQSRSITATDSFESKGDKDVLALKLALAPAPKSEKPAVATHVTRRPAVKKPEKPTVEKPEVAAEKPGEKPEVVDKPVVDRAEKPAVDKPEKPSIDKPVAEKPSIDRPEKPAVDKKPEKPAVEKPAVDKSEKPAADKKPEKPAVEKPAVDKPEKPTADKKPEKPTADKKPEKPAADKPEKPAADKPEKPAADKPASDKNIKVPSWMKQKTDPPAEGATPAPAP